VGGGGGGRDTPVKNIRDSEIEEYAKKRELNFIL